MRLKLKNLLEMSIFLGAGRGFIAAVCICFILLGWSMVWLVEILPVP